MSSALKSLGHTVSAALETSTLTFQPWGHRTNNIMTAEAETLLMCAVSSAWTKSKNKPQVPLYQGSVFKLSKRVQTHENISHKDFKNIHSATFRCRCDVESQPCVSQMCLRGNTWTFRRHSFQQTYRVLMRVYKRRYRTPSNCLPQGFYGPISPMNAYYKLLQHMHSVHTHNVRLEKPTGFPLY